MNNQFNKLAQDILKEYLTQNNSPAIKEPEVRPDVRPATPRPATTPTPRPANPSPIRRHLPGQMPKIAPKASRSNSRPGAKTPEELKKRLRGILSKYIGMI